MCEIVVMGIDCGGTHTDAALLLLNEKNKACRLLAKAKTATNHSDLPASIFAVIDILKKQKPELLANVERITIGTTLEINAIVQKKADKVGLALSAGSGLFPLHFIIGDYFCIVPGGLDHRGIETGELFTDNLANEAKEWKKQGVSAAACIGKFSPRNPAHENAMGSTVRQASGLPVTLGHNLSGKLNFPRRIATAYYNAAIEKIHQNFLDSIETVLQRFEIKAQCRLLKADGGAIPFDVSRKEPVQSILSGPCASVMGAVSVWKNAGNDCSIILDIGGTTTDIAILLNGSPVIDRNGMELNGRRTLVPALASLSVGIGGDSLLHFKRSGQNTLEIEAGPERRGPAMAFGGEEPTLLDALNAISETGQAGDKNSSEKGLLELTRRCGLADDKKNFVAMLAVENSLAKIVKGAYDLAAKINAGPIYTLTGLKNAREARPVKGYIAGGPAAFIKNRLETALGLPLEISPHPDVANAIGAALTIPTASLEVYADTAKGLLQAPSINYEERLAASASLETVKSRAVLLFKEHLHKTGIANDNIEIIEADMFATLDDRGRSSKDMRVICQIKPGIAATLCAD